MGFAIDVILGTILFIWAALYHSFLFWPLRVILRAFSSPLRLQDVNPHHVEQWMGGNVKVTRMSRERMTAGAMGFVSRLRVELASGEKRTLILKQNRLSSLKAIVSHTLFSRMALSEYLAYTLFAEVTQPFRPKCYYANYRWWTRESLFAFEDLAHLCGGKFEASPSLETLDGLIVSLAEFRRASFTLDESIVKKMFPEEESLIWALIGSMWKKFKERTVPFPERFADPILARPTMVALYDLVCNRKAAQMIADLLFRQNRWKGLAHGDGRLDNYFYGNGRKVLIDWQGMMPAAPGRDLSFTILCEVSPEVRRQNERRWVELFRTVSDASDGTTEDYFRTYREGMLFTVILMVFIIAGLDFTDPEAANTLPFIDNTLVRVFAAVDDLDLIGLAQEILGGETKKTN